MNQNPPKGRFRFGLRSLLLLVALCAFTAWGWRVYSVPSTILNIPKGYTKENVEALFGAPKAKRLVQPGSYYLAEYEVWGYAVWQNGTQQRDFVGFRNGRVIGTWEPRYSPPVSEKK